MNTWEPIDVFTEQPYQVLGVVLAEYAAGKTSANLQLVGR